MDLRNSYIIRINKLQYNFQNKVKDKKVISSRHVQNGTKNPEMQ